MNDMESAFFGDDASTARVQVPTFDLAHAHQGEEALRLVQESMVAHTPYQVAFVDMRMPPGWDGIETVRRIWAVDPRIQVVICTAYSDYSWKEMTSAIEGLDNLIILKKPFDNIEVVQLAQALVRKWELSRESETRVADLDATVRRRTHELKLAEDRFTLAFDASPLAQVIETLPEGRIVEVNKAYETLFELSREQAIGLTPETYPGICDVAEWKDGLARLADGESLDRTAQFVVSESGATRHFRFFARPIKISNQPHAIWIFQETTEQVQLEQQFRQSQKMEAIGQLAAGVAHDFNNVMTAILGFTQLSLIRPDLPSDLRRDLGQVLAAGKRASTLTRQLLLFSRKQVTQETLISIDALVAELTPLLQRLVGSGHELNLECPPDLPQIRADRANIEQVILNLVGNACQALERPGRIDLVVSTTDVSETEAERHLDARPGRFLRIEVTDTGPGIPPDVLPRIFDPFFTTKPIGEGTGLGLATSYGIARHLLGWIEVSTRVKFGTTFSVFLPAAPRPEEITPSIAGDESRLTDLPPDGGREHILIVEDDSLVADFVSATLQRHGYQVTCVTSAPAALAKWNKNEGAYDLVFSDMVMPEGMSGADLAAEILRQKPDLPVLLATGYSETLLKKTASKEVVERCTVLLKPYDSATVLNTIRRLLDKAPPPLATASPRA